MRLIGLARQRIMAAPVAVLFAMSGCRSGSSDEPALSGCSDLASTICAKMAACSPLTLRLNYGDEATCVRRSGLSCAHLPDLPGSSWTADKLGSCARAIAASSCFVPVETLSECTSTPGSLGTGAKCSIPSQCATGFCTSGAPISDDGGLSCGTCEVPTVPPAQCGDAGACVPPEICISEATGGAGCHRMPKEGEACDGRLPCAGGLTCIASVCSRPKPAGASCADIAECDLSQSLLCINSSCQMPTWVQPGSPCRLPDQLCTGGACIAAGLDANSPATCIAWAADGSPCDALKGPPCFDPAICLAGKCQVVDPTCR